MRSLKCPTIKNGRIVGNTKPSIRLTTIQPMTIVNRLKECSEIRRSRRSFKNTFAKATGLNKHNNEGMDQMERIYAWINACMLDFGIPCRKDTWPFWAWHSSAGVTANHKYVKGRHQTIGDAGFLELDVPSEFVILSDYMLFELVMGGFYIAASHEDRRNYFSTVAKSQIRSYFEQNKGTVAARKAKALRQMEAHPRRGAPDGWKIAEDDPNRTEIVDSWRRIFDVDPRQEPLVPSYISGDGFTLQATVPFLRSEWIKSVTKL